MVQKLLIISTLPFLLFTGCVKEPTHSHEKDRDEIHQILRLYEQMFVSENLDVLDEIFHPMAMICWQSENPHTLSLEDCRIDLRETFGRRNYSGVKIYGTQSEITENVAKLTCKEIHFFEDTDIDDKYIVYITLVKSQGCWRILTKVTTRQTNDLAMTKKQDDIAKAISDYCGLGFNVQIMGPLTIEEVERESLNEMKRIQKEERADIPLLPFGFNNAEWNIFKSKYKKGDELYFFTSDRKSWEGLYGRIGHVIIRNKEVIAMIISGMS